MRVLGDAVEAELRKAKEETEGVVTISISRDHGSRNSQNPLHAAGFPGLSALHPHLPFQDVLCISTILSPIPHTTPSRPED